LGPEATLPVADTLHALALDLWTSRKGQPPVLLSEDAARRMFLEALPQHLPKAERLALFRRHALARETLAPLAGPEADLVTAAAAQTAEMKALRNQADFTDLLEFLLALVRNPEFIPPFAHVLVDEVQDLSALQLEAVLGLAGATRADGDDSGGGGGKGFFAIGDPDQSIYGFRGAAGNVRERLAARWPDLQVVSLAENYRSGQGILDLSGALLPAHPRLRARGARTWDIELLETPDARHEASLVAARIAKLLGGTSSTLVDAEGANLAPGDVAVLVRFRALIGPYKAALELAGVPCSAPEAEVFWEEPRVAAILRVAERLFGLPPTECAGGEDAEPGNESALEPGAASVVDADLPEFLLLQGPRVLPSALRETPPFDRYFWDGPAFRDLCHAFDAQGGWVGLLDWVRLETDFASIRQVAQKVRIMTLHAAKGLEFEAVFCPRWRRAYCPSPASAARLPRRRPWPRSAACSTWA
jgi:Superfamily I DNA and RNA helicases